MSCLSQFVLLNIAKLCLRRPNRGKPNISLRFAVLVTTRGETCGLARISHQLPTAAGDEQCPTGFSHLRVLDVLSSTPPRPSNRKPSWSQHLTDLATKPGETCGLEVFMASVTDRSSVPRRDFGQGGSVGSPVGPPPVLVEVELASIGELHPFCLEHRLLQPLWDIRQAICGASTGGVHHPMPGDVLRTAVEHPSHGER